MGFFATFLAATGAFCETQQALFFRAERYFSDSLFNPALKEYQNFLAGRPAALNPSTYARQDSVEESTASYKIAICFTKLKENAKAADAFDDFVRLFPKDGRVVDARFLAALAQKSGGNFKEASERFSQVWRRFPASGLAPNALYEAAGCAQSSGDNNHAKDLFAQFCESYGGEEKSQDATIALVKILLGEKDVAAAGARLESAEKRCGANTSFLSRILYYKALLASLAGRPEPAGRFYAAMLSLSAPFPEKEEALLNYISFANDRKDCTTGLSLFKKGADQYQEKGQALTREYLLSWAQTAQNCGAFPEEEKLYRRALVSCAQDSLSAKIMILLSRCQLNRQDLTGALETLQSLSSKDSLTEYGAQAVLALADLYGGQAAYDDAIAAYRRYCRMKGAREADRALFAIGTLYQEKYHRLDAAAQEYENLLRHFGESRYYHSALFALAQCEEDAGGIQAAVQRYYRVVESDAPKELIDKARKRMSYLSSFRATNLENAVRLLAEIAQKKADSSEMAPRLMHVAGIYENDLRDYDRALSLYDQVPIYLRNPPDSVTGRLLLCKARVYEKLYEKARFENNGQKADSAHVNALALYRDILKLPRLPAVSDDAAFRVMMLSSPNVTAYERYIGRYPQSGHLCDVLLLIGRSYEVTAGTGDTVSGRKAIGAYRTITLDHPDNDGAFQAYLGCGRLYMALDKPDSALALTKEFFRHCADSSLWAVGYYIEACSEKSRQNYSVALEKFKKVLYSYPFSGFARQARQGIAETFFALGRYRDALTNFRLCVQHSAPDERTAWAKCMIGRCCAMLGRNSEAKEVLSALVAEKPPHECNGRARFELAGLAQKSGDYVEAQRQYGIVLGLPSYPERHTVLMKMGSLSFDNRAYAAAAASFERAQAFAKTDAESAAASVGVITALIMDGSQKNADRKIAQFIARYGQDREIFAEVAYHEGLWHLVKKEYEKARSHFAVVLLKHAKAARCADAAYQTALTYFYEGKKGKALDMFNRFINDYPQSELVGLAQFKIGMIYHEQNDFEQAVMFFSAALSHVETDSTTRFRAAYNAAIGLQKLSRWLDAGRMYELILDSFPDEISPSAAHLKIGFCLVQASHAADALAHFQKAGDSPSPQEKPEILYWTATCYARMGDYQRAAAEYLKVPVLYAGVGRWDLTSECEAARLYERMGDYRKAVSLYKKIVSTDGETSQLGREALVRMEQLNGIMESQ
jgi:tetratricopeptide (TPR) repeat protein